MIKTLLISRRAAAAAVVAATSMTGLPTVASASPPERVTLDASRPAVVDPFLSETCGTPVTVSITGTDQVTLWRNEAGLVTRELDRFPKAWQTFTAMETGSSVRVAFEGTSTWDYGAGAQIGSAVIIKRTGLIFHIRGATAIAGHEVTEDATVDHFDQGVPIVEGGGVNTKLVGHFPGDVNYPEAICKALKL